MNRRFWTRLVLVVGALMASQGGTYLVLRFFDLADEPFSNLIINAIFLITCIGYIRLFHLSPEDVGLRIVRQRLGLHAGLCLALSLMYVLYYVFAVRISGLRPVTLATLWGLLNYLVVSFAEEIYFRGICYRIVEERFSGRAAILISGLLFGLAHFRQGFGMLPRMFTGWLWASVRYATGMIFLLILPVHFTYNSVWLLFQGNWDSQTTWAYLIPLIELLMGLPIVAWSKKRQRPQQDKVRDDRANKCTCIREVRGTNSENCRIAS